MDYRGIIESKLEQNNGILSSRDIKALNYSFHIPN